MQALVNDFTLTRSPSMSKTSPKGYCGAEGVALGKSVFGRNGTLPSLSIEMEHVKACSNPSSERVLGLEHAFTRSPSMDGRGASKNKTSPTGFVGSGAALDVSPSSSVLDNIADSTLNNMLKTDLVRVASDIAVNQTCSLLSTAGTKLLLFGADGLHIALPTLADDTVSDDSTYDLPAGDLELGQVVAAVCFTGGELAVVTSSGIAPSTGCIYSVLPTLELRSDDKWGNSLAAFPIQLNDSQSLGVVNKHSVYCVSLLDGEWAAVEVAGGMPQGEVVAACGHGDTCWLATSTELFGNGGAIWRMDLSTEHTYCAAKSMTSLAPGCDCVLYAFHSLCLAP